MELPEYKLTSRFYDWLIRRPKTGLAVMILLAGGLGFFSRFEFDSSLDIWFLDDDPDVVAYDEFLERFESDEFIAIALEVDDVFTPEVLADVERLSLAMEARVGAGSVQSLTTAETVERRGDTLDPHPIVEEVPTTQDAANEVRRRVHDDRLVEYLVSEDDRATVVTVEIPHFEDLHEKVALALAVVSLAHETLPDRTLRIAGPPIVDEAFGRYSLQDLRMFGPITMLVILIATLILFRGLWTTVVPIAIVGMTIVSTIGVAWLTDTKLNMITSIIIPLSLAVGVADSVHLISGYRERLEMGLEKAVALKKAWLELWLPVVITSLTTAAGLSSLLLTNLVPLRQFGWMGAMSVMFALLYTLIVIPLVFSMVKAPKVDEPGRNRFMSRVLSGIASFAWRRHWYVAGVSLVLVVLAFAGLPKIEVGADFQRYFRTDDPVLLDALFIDEHLGGTSSMEILIEAPNIQEPQVLREMDAVAEYLEGYVAVSSTMSPAELVKASHEQYFGDPDRFVVPERLATAAQLLEFISGSDIHREYMSLNARLARMTVRLRSTEYRSMIDAMPAVEAHVAATFTGDTHARITGMGKLFANLDTYILQSQIRSFLAAFIIIGFMITVMFRSLRFGLWAIIPNAMPVVLLLGFMGWSGMLLDVATVMIASILLGLIVDDTVHYLARFRLEEREGLTKDDPAYLRKALGATGLGTGRAILATTLILSAGFYTQYFSHFQPTRNFGMMTGTAILIALVCDLVALPAFIRIFPMKRFAAAQRAKGKAKKSVGANSEPASRRRTTSSRQP